MLYEGYKANIEQLISELQQNISDKHQQFVSFQEQALKELTANKNNIHEVLQNLEQQAQANEANRLQHIKSIKQSINNLQQDLQKSISEHRKENNVKRDHQQLLAQKENKISQPTYVLKKEIFEYTQKINLLEKECIGILKEKANDYLDAEKKHRSKTAEIERKSKFEVQKITDEILNPGENDKQKIKEIRRLGIEEISDIKVKYLQKIKDENLIFNDVYINTHQDKEITRAEFNLQIEDFKFKRKISQHKLKKVGDIYDFECYKIANNLDLEYQTTENKIKETYFNNIFETYKQLFSSEKQNINEAIGDRKLINQQIQSSDSQQLNKYQHMIDFSFNSVIQKTNPFHQLLIRIGFHHFNTIFEMIATFYDSLVKDEQKFYQTLIIMNKAPECLQGFEYKSYQQEILVNQKNYIKEQTNRFKTFKKDIQRNLKIIIRQLKQVDNSLKAYLQQEHTHFNNYINKIQTIINNVKTDCSNYAQDYKQQSFNELNENFKAEQQNKLSQDQDLLLDINEIKTDFQVRNKEVDQKIKEYISDFETTAKKDLQAHNKRIKEIKNQITKIKRNYRNELKNNLKEIKIEYSQQIKEVEEEKATKLKIGQI